MGMSLEAGAPSWASLEQPRFRPHRVPGSQGRPVGAAASRGPPGREDQEHGSACLAPGIRPSWGHSSLVGAAPAVAGGAAGAVLAALVNHCWAGLAAVTQPETLFC